jgi:hypothetical protein
MILDIEDLIDWATKYYKNRALKLTKRIVLELIYL